jgi:hypothetical protein
MKPTRLLIASAALALASGAAALADPPAVAPNQMADSWLLQSQGQTLCTVKLSERHVNGGAYAANIPANCQDSLPAGAVGWSPTADGVGLVGADGVTLIDFHRWSESLFVSHRGSGRDLQLSRAPTRTP